VLIVDPSHPTASLNQVGVKAACEKFGLQYSDKPCKTKEEALAAAREAEGKAAFILLGAQALLIDNGGEVARVVKTPTISLTEKPVTEGAVCGLVADDLKLGRMLAESVMEVLVKGKAIKDVPVKNDPKPQLLINTAAAERLGLEIPYEIIQVSKLIGK
jgi:putative ABC transport system substrate-binding protein